jgi:hypothetical protein
MMTKGVIIKRYKIHVMLQLKCIAQRKSCYFRYLGGTNLKNGGTNHARHLSSLLPHATFVIIRKAQALVPFVLFKSFPL